MSELMLYGVLEMPYEMAMSGEISRRQFWGRAQEAAKRLKAAEARLAELDRAPVSTPQQSAQRASVEDDKAFWALAAAWANSRGTIRDHLAKQAFIAHINAWGSAGSGAIPRLQTKEQAQQAIQVCNAFADTLGDDEQHPLFPMMDALMDAIAAWECADPELREFFAEHDIAAPAPQGEQA